MDRIYKIWQHFYHYINDFVYYNIYNSWLHKYYLNLIYLRQISRKFKDNIFSKIKRTNEIFKQKKVLTYKIREYPSSRKVAQDKQLYGELLKNRFFQWWETELEKQAHILSLQSSISATSSQAVCSSEPGGLAYSVEYK